MRGSKAAAAGTVYCPWAALPDAASYTRERGGWIDCLAINVQNGMCERGGQERTVVAPSCLKLFIDATRVCNSQRYLEPICQHRFLLHSGVD